MPSSASRRTASALVRQPSLSRLPWTCISTVRGLMKRPAVERNRHRVQRIRFGPALSRCLPGHAQRLRRGQDGVAGQLHDCHLRHRIPLADGRYLTGPEAETATMTGTVNSAPWPVTIRTEVR